MMTRIPRKSAGDRTCFHTLALVTGLCPSVAAVMLLPIACHAARAHLCLTWNGSEKSPTGESMYLSSRVDVTLSFGWRLERYLRRMPKLPRREVPHRR